MKSGAENLCASDYLVSIFQIMFLSSANSEKKHSFV